MPNLCTSSLNLSPRSSLIRPEDILLLDSTVTPTTMKAITDTKPKSQGHDREATLLNFDPLLQSDSSQKKTDQNDFFSDHPLFTSSNTVTPISKGLPPRMKTKRGHLSHVSLGSAEMSGIFITRPRGATADAREISHMGTSSLPIDFPIPEGKGRKKEHRKTSSLAGGMADLFSSMGSNNGSPIMSPARPRLASTPSRLMGRNSGNNTPSQKISPCRATPIVGGLQLPLLAKPSPTSLLLESDDLVLRTSEQEPARHQVEIAPVSELLIHAKLCAFMDMFRQSDSDFNLSYLVGASNFALRDFAHNGKTSLQTIRLKQEHRSIVKALLECADNITVEGYIAQAAETAIFDLPALSQIVVVFRGNDDQQAKPVRTKQARQITGTTELHPDQNVTVVPFFREAYFELESDVYALIDRLTESNPFANIVLCGHSFGGALATLGAVRYASYRPTMLVSAHAFGSPKVGAVDFRQLVHSLANLKMLRVETKDDPVVQTPVHTVGKKWIHVGHTIALGKVVAAYRFDDFKPAPASVPLFRKVERDSKAYVAALDDAKEKWVSDFVGIGDGVLGGNDEKRLMT